MRKLKGSCVCKTVQIEVPDDFSFIGNCHCAGCRKWTGSAFASGGGVPTEALRFLRGEESVVRYRQSEATTLVFCGKCGSSLYSLKPALDLCIVRLGVLDDAPTQTPQLHMFTGSKAPWHEITDDLPAFEETP